MNTYSVPEAAEKLGWSRWYLARLVRDRKVPFRLRPSGRRAYLTDDDITEILANGQRRALEAR